MTKLRLLFILALLVFVNQVYGQIQYDTLTVSTNNDSYVRSNSAATNYNSDTVCYVKKESGGQYRTFIQYDLSGIPDNAIIVSAKMKYEALAVNNAQSHPLYISRADAAWQGNTITWNNQPGEITSDQVSVAHNECNSTGTQEFNVTDHVQHFVNYPHLNFGWSIRLQNETGGTTRGITWASSSHGTASYYPELEIEYLLPVEVDGYVSHCTNGNDDGSINASVSLGAGSYDSYTWLKYDGGVGYEIETGSDVANIDVSGLSNGLYLCYVEDDSGYMGYKYFLVGEEGTTTTVAFEHDNADTSALFNEDCIQAYFTADGDGDNNYGDYVYFNATDWSSYHGEAYMKFQVDFDDYLMSLTQADLYVFSTSPNQHRNPSQSSNATTVSLVTEDWSEYLLTYDSRPTRDDTITIAIDETAVSEYRDDTLDLLEFVEYWQDNPGTNFGINMALDSYTNPSDTRLIYANYDHTSASDRPKFEVSFTVKEAIETTFNDTTGLGTLTVNAPAGDLPYTYLISYSPLPVMDSIWTAIKDSVPLDSLTLFRGGVNSQNHTFYNLSSERYYVGVYDNSGSRILATSGVISPSLAIFDSTNIAVQDDSIYVQTGQTTGDASFNFQIEGHEQGGFEFQNLALGDMVIGYNGSGDEDVRGWTDFDYAIRIVDSTGAYDIVSNNTILHSDTTTVGDTIRILQDNYVMYFIINDTIVHQEDIDGSIGDDFRPELYFGENKGKIIAFHAIGYMLAPKPIDYVVNQPECNMSNASITINSIGWSKWGITGITYDIIELSGDTSILASPPGSTLPFSIDVAAGDYEIQYNWTSGGSTYSMTENITVGYPVYWNLLDAYFTSVSGSLNTIKTNTVDQEAQAISQNILQSGTDGWVDFNAAVKKYYEAIFFDTYEDETATLASIRNGTVCFLDDTNDPIIKVRLYNLGGDIINKVISVYDATGASDSLIGTQSIYDNGPVRIDLSSGNFDVYYDGSSSSIGQVSEGTSTDHKVEATATNGMIIDTYASFCYGLTTSETCAELQYELDGSYYVTNSGVFCFVYNEEYNDPNITFNIYTISNNLIATQDDFDLPDMIHGENRVVLNLSSIECACNGHFVLEVINSKNEKFYLRYFADLDGACSFPIWCFGLPEFTTGGG